MKKAGQYRSSIKFAFKSSITTVSWKNAWRSDQLFGLERRINEGRSTNATRGMWTELLIERKRESRHRRSADTSVAEHSVRAFPSGPLVLIRWDPPVHRCTRDQRADPPTRGHLRATWEQSNLWTSWFRFEDNQFIGSEGLESFCSIWMKRWMKLEPVSGSIKWMRSSLRKNVILV